MILVERQDLWQPRQPSIPTKRKSVKFHLILRLGPFHLLAIAMCFFLVSGLFAIDVPKLI